MFLAKPNWITLDCSFDKRRLNRDESGSTTASCATRGENLPYCTASCSNLVQPWPTGITLGATGSLRLTSSDPIPFCSMGVIYKLWKVFLNLGNPAQDDPATKPATRSNQYSG